MRHKIILLLALVVAFFSFSPMSRAMSQSEIEKLPSITAPQAYYLFKLGKIILIDTTVGRRRAEIVGAYYIPATKFEQMRIKLPRNIIIGVFCH